jgi:hypothetical protein
MNLKLTHFEVTEDCDRNKPSSALPNLVHLMLEQMARCCRNARSGQVAARFGGAFSDLTEQL